METIETSISLWYATVPCASHMASLSLACRKRVQDQPLDVDKQLAAAFHMSLIFAPSLHPLASLQTPCKALQPGEKKSPITAVASVNAQTADSSEAEATLRPVFAHVACSALTHVWRRTCSLEPRWCAPRGALLTQTPDAAAAQGRLIDHLRNTQLVGLEDLQALVLDEADRLLSMGFADEVRNDWKS